MPTATTASLSCSTRSTRPATGATSGQRWPAPVPPGSWRERDSAARAVASWCAAASASNRAASCSRAFSSTSRCPRSRLCFDVKPCAARSVARCSSERASASATPGALDVRLRPQHLGLGGADPLLQALLGARVEQRRRARDQRGQRRAGRHRRAGLELDPQQPAGERRGHDVAVAHARLAVLVDGLAERPARDRRGLDLDRLRTERPGEHARRDDPRQQPTRLFAPTSCPSPILSSSARRPCPARRSAAARPARWRGRRARSPPRRRRRSAAR